MFSLLNNLLEAMDKRRLLEVQQFLIDRLPDDFTIEVRKAGFLLVRSPTYVKVLLDGKVTLVPMFNGSIKLMMTYKPTNDDRDVTYPPDQMEELASDLQKAVYTNSF